MTEVPTSHLQAFEKVYNNLFESNSTLGKARDAVLANRIFDYSQESPEVSGRSVAWKLFLIQDEPLNTSSNELDPTNLLKSLQSSRNRYAELLSAKMQAPDGSYPEGFIIPGSSTYPSPPKENRLIDLERNNPLSLHNDNPWKEWFSAQELRKTISQDVERTFPEIDFFRNADVQDHLTNVLFLYSIMNPDIGYRQGMHELLAPLYYAVDVDSFSDTSGSDLPAMATELCAKVWVAADSWVLFESVMRYASRWYEWREPSKAQQSSPLSNHVQLNPDGQAQLKPYIAPIVQDCNQIQSTLLRITDPLLWKHLQSSGIEPQIYGIRWLRLLFTREFSMPDAMRLWDALFALDATLDVVPWVCVAMLIRIRNILLPSDYTTQLTALLRYPTPTIDESTPAITHHTFLLVRQAYALQSSATPATGVSLVVENRNLLNIPMEVPEPPPAPPRKKIPSHSRDKSTAGHLRQQSSQQGSIPEMITRGLFDRGESLGINKTLMSAVSELRRNIPELASFVRSPLQTPSIPMTDEGQPDERPPWEPKSRRELERETAQLRDNDKRLGESLTWVVDILLQDEGSSEDVQKLKKQKQEALESLSYVRDVLVNNFTAIEEERLFGEEELSKRKAKAMAAKLNAEEASLKPRSVEMPRPAPVSVVDSPPKTSGNIANVSGPGGHPIVPLPRSPQSTPPPTLNPPRSPNATRLAPWNYTKSNFSSNGTSSLPATSLPRLPPPTSTFQRTPVSSTFQDSTISPKQREKPPAKSPKGGGDPLGVL